MEQLLLSKRLFLSGANYSEKSDSISAGIAISMFQDSVEALLWHLIKELDLQVRDNESFTRYFDKIDGIPPNEGLSKLPLRAKMLELNKARVNFKHYGNLPDPSEARKFRTYTEDFLTLTMEGYCSISFDSLTLVELITFSDVKGCLREAESFLSEGDTERALQEVSKAKKMLLSKFHGYFPEVDRNLSKADELIGARHSGPFKFISKYLERNRESSIITMLGIPLKDYVLTQRVLPSAVQMMAGNWRFSHGFGSRRVIGLDEATKAKDLVVNLAIKAQSVIG